MEVFDPGAAGGRTVRTWGPALQAQLPAVSVPNSSHSSSESLGLGDSYSSQAEDPVFIFLVSALLCCCMREALSFYTVRRVQLHCL